MRALLRSPWSFLGGTYSVFHISSGGDRSEQGIWAGIQASRAGFWNSLLAPEPLELQPSAVYARASSGSSRGLLPPSGQEWETWPTAKTPRGTQETGWCKEEISREGVRNERVISWDVKSGGLINSRQPPQLQEQIWCAEEKAFHCFIWRLIEDSCTLWKSNILLWWKYEF